MKSFIVSMLAVFTAIGVLQAEVLRKAKLPAQSPFTPQPNATLEIPTFDGGKRTITLGDNKCILPTGAAIYSGRTSDAVWDNVVITERSTSSIVNITEANSNNKLVMFLKDGVWQLTEETEQHGYKCGVNHKTQSQTQSIITKNAVALQSVKLSANGDTVKTDTSNVSTNALTGNPLIDGEAILLNGGETVTNEIDLLIAFDKSAAEWVRALDEYEEDDHALDNYAAARIEECNQVYARTELNKYFTFNLAGTVEIDSDCSVNDYRELIYIQNPDDETERIQAYLVEPAYVLNDLSGIDNSVPEYINDYKKIRAKREEVHADIVSFWVSDYQNEKVLNGTTGTSIALDNRTILNNEPGNMISDYAYNVCIIQAIDRTCALAHECGHAFGAGHTILKEVSEDVSEEDRVSGPQLYNYSMGYYFTVTNEYVSMHGCTTMGYTSDGFEPNIYATRWGYAPANVDSKYTWENGFYTEINTFSSSKHTYTYTLTDTNGIVRTFEIPLGTPTNDNTRIISETYLLVANYRARITSNTNQIIVLKDPRGYTTSFTGEGSYALGEKVTLTATVPDNVTFVGWYGAYNAETDTFTEPLETVGKNNYQKSSVEIAIPEEFTTKSRTIYARTSISSQTINLVDPKNLVKSFSGAGTYKHNTEATLKANLNGTTAFAGWYNNYDPETDTFSDPLETVKNTTWQDATAKIALTEDFSTTERTIYAKIISQNDDQVSISYQVEPEYTTKEEITPITINCEALTKVTVAVSGLPTGLKFTNKELVVKDSKTKESITYPANTIYGTPTKSGYFTATIKATSATKATATTNVAFVVRGESEYILTTTVDGLGSVTGAGIYTAGKKVSLKATAQSAKKATKTTPEQIATVFSYWEVDGKKLSQEPSLSYVMPSADTTLKAVFVPVSADTNVAVFCEVASEYTSQQEISSITLNCESQSKVTTTVSGLPSGLKFTNKELVVTDSKTKESVTYPANTIYGTPTKSGYFTVTIKVTNASKVTTTTNFTFVVRGENEYILATTVDGLGSVTGAGIYAAGKKVSLKATAQSAKKATKTTPEQIATVFSYWELDGKKLSQEPSLSYVMPSEDTTLKAVFVPATEDTDISLKINDKTITENASDVVFNTSGAFDCVLDISAVSLPKASVSGLPAGLKFTAKEVITKDSKTKISTTNVANSIYGTATKPGTYAVKVSLTDTTIKKALTRAFTIVVDNLQGANDVLNVTSNGVAVALKNERGESYQLMMGVEQKALPAILSTDSKTKASISNLPTGLKYDAKTGKITGTPTKAGTYTVTIKVGSLSSTFTVVVEALPDWMIGTFEGYGYGSEPDDEYLQYTELSHVRIVLTVTQNGQVSATITDGDSKIETSRLKYNISRGEHDENNNLIYYVDKETVDEDEIESLTLKFQEENIGDVSVGKMTGILTESEWNYIKEEYDTPVTKGIYYAYQNVWKTAANTVLTPTFAKNATTSFDMSDWLPGRNYERYQRISSSKNLAGCSLLLKYGNNGAVTLSFLENNKSTATGSGQLTPYGYDADRGVIRAQLSMVLAPKNRHVFAATLFLELPANSSAIAGDQVKLIDYILVDQDDVFTPESIDE